MTLYHYPMSIPEDYSPEQVVAILELLETLHDAIYEIYQLQLCEIHNAQLADEEDDLDEDIPF